MTAITLIAIIAAGTTYLTIGVVIATLLAPSFPNPSEYRIAVGLVTLFWPILLVCIAFMGALYLLGTAITRVIGEPKP